MIRRAVSKEHRRRAFRRIPRLIFGLMIFSVGLALQIEAGLGLSPWDVLHEGIDGRTPLSFGITTILVSGLVMLFWIPLRQPLGLGTVLNAVGVGSMIDLSLWLIGDVSNLAVRIAFLLVGVVMAGIGSGLYIGVRLGPGPRDGLMTGIAELGISIRLARFLIEATVLVLGWLLGGTVGYGTLVFTVFIGPLVQFFLRIFDMGEVGNKPVKPRPNPVA